MSLLALACSALLATAPPAVTANSTDASAYRAAAASAGRDANAHLNLALWCEARGLSAERLKHLAMAVLIDPKNAAARSLLGLVAHRGRWEPAQRVAERLKAEEALNRDLAEYNSRRAKLPQEPGGKVSRADLARAHVALGQWCARTGLKAEATAHFSSALALDPNRITAWKELGYVRHNGRWMTPEQIAAEQRDIEAQHKADRRWEPLLDRWRVWLANRTKRAEAETALANVNDPRAVPAIVRTFYTGNEAEARVAVRLLGQVHSAPSSRALATMAVLTVSERLRSAAIEALRGREPRDYAPMLVEMIQEPMRYRVQPVLGPGLPGALLIETSKLRMLRGYEAPPVLELTESFFGYIGLDPYGVPVAVRGKELRALSEPTTMPWHAEEMLAAIEERTAGQIAEAQCKAIDSQQRLMADVAWVDDQNTQMAHRNDRIRTVLLTGLDVPKLDDHPDSWRKWWYDQLGYSYEPPPQIQQTVAFTAVQQAAPPRIYSCFVAGTPVRTLAGQRPIESILAGDRVMSQDPATGELSFQTVLVAHHNKPGQTLEVKLENGETLVPSIYHRFWRVGKGWAMARELTSGDLLRTVAGASRVVSVSAGPVAPLFNLDVAGSRTFFVGRHDALVHDNTLPDPGIKPFDAARKLMNQR
jgi:tetratricopeptide (TPR) repeat protein